MPPTHTTTVQRSGAAGDVQRSRLRWALVALCVTVTTSYGVLYYAFPVLTVTISADTGWSLTSLMAAFSAGQVVSALAGTVVGRWVDRVGPRPVMTTGSLIAAPAVAGMAAAPSLPWFFLAWLVAGVPMAMLFYPPAFAALTRWYGPRRVRALTALTLVAGFASTIFAPLTAVLAASYGWRATYLLLAAVLAVVTLPLHVLLLRPAWSGPAGGAAEDPSNEDTTPGLMPRERVRAIVRSPAFLALVAALALGAFVIYGTVVNIAPLFEERGLGADAAAAALAVGGVGQVLGRFCYAPLARRVAYVPRTVVVILACALGTALIGLVPGPFAVLMAAAMLIGAGRGIYTLVEATAVSDRWGTSGYGTLNGILHLPLVLCIALAPWAGSAMAVVTGGYPRMFLVLTLVGLVATGLAALTRVRRQPRPQNT